MAEATLTTLLDREEDCLPSTLAVTTESHGRSDTTRRDVIFFGGVQGDPNVGSGTELPNGPVRHLDTEVPERVEILVPIDQLPPGPVLVHSDAFVMRRFAPRTTDRHRILDAHIETLGRLTGGRPTYVPTFNYDFCRTGLYDPSEDPSQVGDITEHVRQVAPWRTEVPVFHFAGLPGTPPPAVTRPRPDLVLDPFGEGSVFDLLVRESGAVLFYGAPLASFTMLHHVERFVGPGPVYRYDKVFEGVVRLDSEDVPVKLKYHVRPAGTQLGYDWERIGRLLVEADALCATEHPHLRWMDAGKARQVLEAALVSDPLALLDQTSRSWVAALLDDLGRRLRIDDFEGADHG
jgi:aminoglycoside N3'-acetyltransferase